MFCLFRPHQHSNWYSHNPCTQLGWQFLPYRPLCLVSRANHHVMDRSSTLPMGSAFRAIPTIKNWTSVTTPIHRNMPGPSPHRWLHLNSWMFEAVNRMHLTVRPHRRDCDARMSSYPTSVHVPCQPTPVSPFRPEACAPDSRGYANVVCKPSITMPATTGAPIEPLWVWKPTSRPQILALMSLEITLPTKNTQFGNNSTHENYMWMLQHVREKGRPRHEDHYNILAGVHQALVNHPVCQTSWRASVPTLDNLPLPHTTDLVDV